ncbi:MAG TPA: hypothetical protein VIU62_15155 [Chloroflexota bacterium]|jgi:hypothetical protein
MDLVRLPRYSQGASRRRSRRLRRALLIGAFLVFVGTIGVTRLVFAHTPVDTLVSNGYAVAIADDPAHAGLYGDAYGLYRTATGHPQAAHTQALRASQHDLDWPPVQALRRAWRWLRDTLG